MKYSLLLIVALITVSMMSFGQKFNGGVVLGVTGSQVAGDTYSGFNKAGIVAGGYVNLQFKPRRYIQMELEFIQKGSRHNPLSSDSVPTTYKLNLGYLEMPLLYKQQFSTRMSFEVGPAVSFLAFHNEYRDGFENEQLGQPPFKKVNLSLIAGITFSVTQNLKVNFRTCNSLLPIRTGHVFGYVRRFDQTYGQYNDVLELSLHYQLNHVLETN